MNEHEIIDIKIRDNVTHSFLLYTFYNTPHARARARTHRKDEKEEKRFRWSYMLLAEYRVAK